jgi:S-adenosylmethionine/arginine decarboxylase-like enzyme
MDMGLPILHRIVQELNLQVVSETGHQFQPMGWSYAFVLSESHFTIHTYPEHRSCYLDIFCCNKDFNANHAIHVIQSHFQTTRTVFQILRR